ncbi:MAG: prephenate dehydratase domain-containing protein [Bifidobacterium psychraerophilum]|uniref:prephenate dehydratase n=1 Tax=Bifidobacterium psychraerophilum TaxID=218140 RepID=UPI0039E8D2BC
MTTTPQPDSASRSLPVHVHYLGPEGSFTHQAANDAVRALLPGEGGALLIAERSASAIMSAVESGDGWGVIAWESNVEGYVVPNLDAMIDARNIAAFARVGVPIAFDAFTRDGDSQQDPSAQREVSAHPHGLAQCSGYIEREGLRPVPAASNAAACRDVEPGQVALGPRICGSLYGLRTLDTEVQDYQGARTEFLVMAQRTQAAEFLHGQEGQSDGEFESIVAFIPLSTGPGVLADALDVLRDAGLNMTSFISRPIKGNDGTYSFIATIDAAPWQQRFREALKTMIARGDWVKTLAVYPRRERPNPPVTAWMLPDGGVSSGFTAAEDDRAMTNEYVSKELLW